MLGGLRRVWMAVALVVAALSLIGVSGSQAQTTSYKYDSQGRLIEVSTPAGLVTTYTYDALGNRITVQVSNASWVSEITDGVFSASSNWYEIFSGLTGNGMRDGSVADWHSVHATDVDYPSYVQVDLQSDRAIQRVDLMSIEGWESNNDGTLLEYKTQNGTNWVTLGTLSNSSSSAYRSYYFNGATARYIRLLKSEDQVTIGEFRIYGGAPPPAPPIAVNDSETTTQNTAKTFDPRVNDSDPNGNPLTIQSVTQPSGQPGAVTFTGTSVTYTPPNGFTGNTSFTYTINDGTGLTATGTVNMTVSAAPPNGEIIPTVYSASSNWANSSTGLNSTGMRDGFNNAANTTHGTNSGTGQYIRVNLGTPQNIARIDLKASVAPGWNANYTNGATVQRSIDGVNWTTVGTVSGLTSTNTVSVSLGGQSAQYIQLVSNGSNYVAVGDFRVYGGDPAPNQPPTAVNDSRTTPKNVPLTFDPRTNDTDPNSDTLTVESVTQPASGTGTASFTGTSVTYTPPSGYSGTATFTYTINDGNGGTSTASIFMTIPANSPPVAVNDAVYTVKNIAQSFDPRANDSDPDSDPLTISGVSNASGGTPVITGGGTGITFTPSNNFLGPASFTYTVSDGQGGQQSATVTVYVSDELVPSSMVATSNIDDDYNLFGLGNDFTHGLDSYPYAKMRDGLVATLDTVHMTENGDTNPSIEVNLGAARTLTFILLHAIDDAFQDGGVHLNGAVLEYWNGSSYQPIATISGATEGGYVWIYAGHVNTSWLRLRKSSAVLGVGDFRILGY